MVQTGGVSLCASTARPHEPANLRAGRGIDRRAGKPSNGAMKPDWRAAAAQVRLLLLYCCAAAALCVPTAVAVRWALVDLGILDGAGAWVFGSAFSLLGWAWYLFSEQPSAGRGAERE